MKRLTAIVTLAALWPIAVAQVTTAQTYPTRPITMNVPFAAGGPTDTIARVIAQRMSAVLGQSIIIENVTGADGTIGVGRAARAAPDGYMLSVGQWSTHVLNGAAYALPYDLLKDFEPVALMSTNPLVIVTYKGVPATNLTELIDWLKANPERTAVGIGSMAHRVSAVYFQNLTGIKLTLVPYRGAAPAMQDMMAGQIQLMFDQAATSLPLVRAARPRRGLTQRPTCRPSTRPACPDSISPCGRRCGRRARRREPSSTSSIQQSLRPWPIPPFASG
jgi:tripartite-type tricarboxylate transporter receptor subunit TctC